VKAIDHTMTFAMRNHAPSPTPFERQPVASRLFAIRPDVLMFSGAIGGWRAPKSLWRIDEAGHLCAFAAHPREYERRVTRFLGRALFEEG
jgi:hypothetical protein